MSGTDTSTPAQRQAFLTLLEGTGGGSLAAAAAAVQNCTIAIPTEAAFLLELPAGATFATAAAQLPATVGSRPRGHLRASLPSKSEWLLSTLSGLSQRPPARPGVAEREMAGLEQAGPGSCHLHDLSL